MTDKPYQTKPLACWQKAKELRELLRAELDAEARAHIKKRGDRVTEALVNSYIVEDKGFQEAVEEYNEAKYRSNIFSSAVKAFDHRKYALQDLVKLWAGSYFAGPTEPRDTKKLNIREKANDSLDKKVTENMNKKRKKKN